MPFKEITEVLGQSDSLCGNLQVTSDWGFDTKQVVTVLLRKDNALDSPTDKKSSLIIDSIRLIAFCHYTTLPNWVLNR
jgi:hypothetical protein